MHQTLKISRLVHEAFSAIGAAMRGPLAAGLVLAGLVVAAGSPVFAAENAAAPCEATKSGVPCMPVVELPSTPKSSSRPVQGRTAPGNAPSAQTDVATKNASDPESSADSKRKRKSTFTFFSRDFSGEVIYLRFFSQNRNWVWPGGSNVFVLLPDGVQRYVRLRCKRGEKICYGGQTQSGSKFYGVGINGNFSCAACCYFCRGGAGSVNFF